MGAVLGSCAGAAFRTLVPRRLFAGTSSAKIACESPLTDDEILEALKTAPLVHPTTPKNKRSARVSTTVRQRFDWSAGPTSQAKTGDVILFDKKKGGALGAMAESVGLNQRDITKGCFTHAGIVIRIGGKGGGGGVDDSRMLVMESVLSKMPFDIVDGASAQRLAGAIRFYPLFERVLTYPGHTFLLPLQKALTAEEEQRLLTAACAIWRRNPDFDIDGLVEAGFHRLPITQFLFGDRFEPKEDLEAFFCSELVGHLLETARPDVWGADQEGWPKEVNLSQLAPNDLLKMVGVFDISSLQPVRLYHGERDAAMEAKYELIGGGHEQHEGKAEEEGTRGRAAVWKEVEGLRTGDVVLVKSTHTMGKMIQTADWTDWDHVAMVVRQEGGADALAKRAQLLGEKPLPYDQMHGDDVPKGVGMFWSEKVEAGQLQLLEATKAGSYSYPFQEVLECRGHKYQNVAVRKLEPPLTEEQCAKVEAFVLEVWGRPYDIVGNVGEFLTGLKAILFDDVGSDSLKEKGEEDLQRLFCSELVAEALQRAGVLPERTLNSNESEYFEHYHEARDERLGKLSYSGWVE